MECGGSDVRRLAGWPWRTTFAPFATDDVTLARSPDPALSWPFSSAGSDVTKPLTVLIASAGRRVELVRIFRHAVAELTPGGRVLAVDASWYSSALHEADD